ncbi:Spo0B domain-containing protein [Virgibacillus ihumii]|uniref:Spo0B domain-containing protein n=1 Tax=Virgibacillus ihumii TaxID=2686091 RepID=UPI00157D07C2|nr:Spo0B domain-containing protein [Virgibacillus ihumii]
MLEEDVIQILRHNRHDLMNHLQIVQGYLSMDKPEKARSKLETFMKLMEEERKLVNLNIPKFALCLIQFNTNYQNFRLSYHIHTARQDLRSLDDMLVEQCRYLMGQIADAADEMELYMVNLQLNELDEVGKSGVEVKLAVQGNFTSEIKIKRKDSVDLSPMVSQSDEGIICSIQIPCD